MSIKVSGGGGGGGYSGVTSDPPNGLNVAGPLLAANVSTTDDSLFSTFLGGATVGGTGLEVSPAIGNDPLEVRWNDSGIARLMYRALDGGVNLFNTPIRLHAQIQTGQAVAHPLGSYSGNAVPIYAEDGTTLLGYFPLYA